MHRLQELVRLHRMGVGDREVARLLGMGPNTERQYRRAIERAQLLEGQAEDLPDLEALRAAVLAHSPPKLPPQQTSSVALWRPQVEGWMREGVGPRAMFDRLRLEHADFAGSYAAVKRLVRTIVRERGVQPAEVAVPVETEPGQVAQVDFGYAGPMWDPDTKTLRRAWVFVMVLGFSRHLFAQLVFDQKAETWLRLHVNAFASFGGVPRTVVPDNLKAAVVRAAFAVDDDSELHRSYRELARHYGVQIDPTPPRAPKKKGKVESAVKYIKRNALAGRRGEDVVHVSDALARWTTEIAGGRVHGTTGHKPLELFAQRERDALLPLPCRPYELVVWKQTTVHSDCHIEFDGRLYSVPWRLVGQRLWTRATPSSVVVYHEDQDVVARHDRRGDGWRTTLDEHLPDHRGSLRHRRREYWEERAAQMGDDVRRFVRDVFDADDVLSQLRKVQAIVTHLEKFPVERVRAACRRATFYGATTYLALRDILRRGLDMHPLTEAAETATASSWTPRFARDTRALALFRRDLPEGGSHGAH
jgi:transposase